MRRALAAAVATKQRRRWPFVAAGTGATAFAAVAIAMALTRGSAAPAEPPAERPLPDQYQRGLDVVAANLAHYTHTDVLRLICPIDRLFRTNAKLPDDTYRTYLHRLHDLLSARAGDDLAAECIPYEQ
jgi:hypothetical protein